MLIPQNIQPENSHEIYVILHSFPVGLKVFEKIACSIYSPHMFITTLKCFQKNQSTVILQYSGSWWFKPRMVWSISNKTEAGLPAK